MTGSGFTRLLKKCFCLFSLLQVKIFEEDFRKERSDRERMNEEKEDLRRQVERLQGQITNVTNQVRPLRLINASCVNVAMHVISVKCAFLFGLIVFSCFVCVLASSDSE